jgi:hypothetical protein
MSAMRKMLLAVILGQWLVVQPGQAQEPQTYRYGSVWDVSMIQVEPGLGETYMESLKAFHVQLMDEAVKQKVVKSYRIFVGTRANPQDWDILLMTEYDNWASFDTAIAKLDAIAAKVHGSTSKAQSVEKDLANERMKVRRIFGNKVIQEVHFVR